MSAVADDPAAGGSELDDARMPQPGPMTGVRVVEVAQFTFTPAAGAVLADWGADVIKVEHAEMGDAQRGLRMDGMSSADGNFEPIMEGPNRGKRSIGLDLANESALDVLYALVRTADVFLTNFLPAARRRLRIDVDDIREIKPDIIYARGSALGPRGPERESGGFDASTFWARGASAMGATPADSPRLLGMPAAAYGDNIGGLAIAGGISAALFARERTGIGSVVDVSLLSVGAWATSLSINRTLASGNLPVAPLLSTITTANPFNPLIGNFPTADGRWIALNTLQAGRYWADACRCLDIEQYIDDDRFATPEALQDHCAEAGAIITAAMAARTYDQLVEHFRTYEGQWAPTNTFAEIARDPQVVANGYVSTVFDVGGTERQLVAAPIQFDERSPALRRAPQFAEHTDDILRELARTDDELMQLKIDGAVT